MVSALVAAGVVVSFLAGMGSAPNVEGGGAGHHGPLHACPTFAVSGTTCVAPGNLTVDLAGCHAGKALLSMPSAATLPSGFTQGATLGLAYIYVADFFHCPSLTLSNGYVLGQTRFAFAGAGLRETPLPGPLGPSEVFAFEAFTDNHEFQAVAKYNGYKLARAEIDETPAGNGTTFTVAVGGALRYAGTFPSQILALQMDSWMDYFQSNATGGIRYAHIESVWDQSVQLPSTVVCLAGPLRDAMGGLPVAGGQAAVVFLRTATLSFSTLM